MPTHYEKRGKLNNKIPRFFEQPNIALNEKLLQYLLIKSRNILTKRSGEFKVKAVHDNGKIGHKIWICKNGVLYSIYSDPFETLNIVRFANLVENYHEELAKKLG